MPAAGNVQQKFLNEDDGTCFGFLRAQSSQMSPSTPAYLELRLARQFLVSFVRAMRVLSLAVRTFTLCKNFHSYKNFLVFLFSRFLTFSCYNEDSFTPLKTTLPSCINSSLGNLSHPKM